MTRLPIFILVYALLTSYWISEEAVGSEFHLIQADRLDLEYMRLSPSNRDPYAPEYTGRWQDRASLKWDIGLLDDIVYWNNNVHTETIDTGQVKTVGWEFYAGIHLGEYADIFRYHHSRHIMDEGPQQSYNYPDGTGNPFPVEDAYGITVHFIPVHGEK